MPKHTHKKLITVLILSLVLMMLMPLAALAEENELKTVRVSCGINNALYFAENGEVEGYCSKYITQLADINGWQLEYVEGSWTESVQNLYDGKIDLLFPTQMTDERLTTMGFSTAIGGYQPIGLFADAESKLCYDDFAGFDGAKIAVSAGTSNELALQAYAKANGFTYTPVYLNTTEDKKQALTDGTVDLLVFSTLNDVPDGKVVAMLDYLPFYYCTNIENTQLLNQLNYGMNQMVIRHPDTVQDVFYNFMNKNISFAYTNEEQTEIENHGKVTIGAYLDTAPLFDVDEKGNYIGIYVDLIERIKEISGLDIEIKALDRSKYAFDVLDEGGIDYIIGSSDQALKYSNAQGYEQSEGVMDYYSISITRNDYSFENDAAIKVALTSARRYWAPILAQTYSNAEYDFYESSKDCLDAVESGKADVTVLNTWEYNYQSKNQRYQSLMEWENTRTLSKTVFVSRQGQSELISTVINKAIEQISNAEKEGIITANLNRAYNSYSFIDRLYQARQTLYVCGLVIVLMIVVASVYSVMRKRSMRELEAKNRQLENANDAKDVFLSRMSHELRTPLNAINGYAKSIEQDLDEHKTDDAKTRLNTESILRAAKYQLAIISDLLDIQKIESGKLEVTPIEVDFARYMSNIVDMIKPEAAEKKIDFTYKRLSVVNDTYFIDGVRLQQVLLNLLHNAVKFTPEGGSVKMTAEVVDRDETANTLKFVISDTGIGMSDDFMQNYLFRRFAQEYKGNTSPYEGCGTGLALSREIIHLMGGEITCRSEQGKGSAFTVILTAKHISKTQSSAPTPVYEYRLDGIRVLLCEDNKMNSEIESRMLKRMGCTVDIANDGKIGLDKYLQSSEGYYDVVLMDIRMPNMDGLEAARNIRAAKRSDAASLPIIAVSANAFEEDVNKSLAAGMNEHVAKPVNPETFYEKIKQHCGRTAKQTEAEA